MDTRKPATRRALSSSAILFCGCSATEGQKYSSPVVGPWAGGAYAVATGGASGGGVAGGIWGMGGIVSTGGTIGAGGIGGGGTTGAGGVLPVDSGASGGSASQDSGSPAHTRRACELVTGAEGPPAPEP